MLLLLLLFAVGALAHAVRCRTQHLDTQVTAEACVGFIVSELLSLVPHA